MPMTDDPRWMCFRKKAYPTEKMAKTVARSVRARFGDEVHPYLCPSCSQFHIGRGQYNNAVA